ncbi:hypothetical protein D3C86_1801730 [compost metagenome]
MSLRPLRICTRSDTPSALACNWKERGSSWPTAISRVRCCSSRGRLASALRLRSRPLVLKPEPICTSSRSSSVSANSRRNSARICAALAGARRSWAMPGGSRWKRAAGVA